MYNKCSECPSCVDLNHDGTYYCNMKISDSRCKELDISTCVIDPESKPTYCLWDQISDTVSTLGRDDQRGLKCIAKMFGGDSVKDWFEDDPLTNKEWLASLPAEKFYVEFKKAENLMAYALNTRLAMIEWLDEKHVEDPI